MSKSSVSVIIATKNEEKNIEKCLISLKEQTYKNIEIIVVDNHSKDRTRVLAKKFTTKVFTYGPERSSQRNFGARKATGEYLLFIDADMRLSKNVIKACVEQIEKQKVGEVVIPEDSEGEGFWAKCKSLEKKFYQGVDWIEAARFFSGSIFKSVSGYDNNLISGEDWDLSERVKKRFGSTRIIPHIIHYEGRLSLLKTIRKKYYYSKMIKGFTAKSKDKIPAQVDVVKRFKLFFTNPKKLFKDPILGVGMLFMKMCEYAVGIWGYIFSSFPKK